jgi:CheY-like chemotaxis protein
MEPFSPTSSRPVIVLAEDDEDYLMIIKLAFEEAGFTGTLKIVNNTCDLMQYLESRKAPHLILLDLKSAPNDWRAALEELKSAKRYESIPVVVLTASNALEDIRLCERYVGCSLALKPMSFDDWKGFMGEIIRTGLEPSPDTNNRYLTQFTPPIKSELKNLRKSKRQYCLRLCEGRSDLAVRSKACMAEMNPETVVALRVPSVKKMNSPGQCTPTILIAEDDPDDRLLLEEVLKEFSDVLDVYFVEDGEELMEYLVHPNESAKPAPPRPSLILLDLIMPRVDGRQALVEIKRSANLKDIPLIVWATSQREEDMLLCSEAGADGYVVKPSSFADMCAAIRSIIARWLQLSSNFDITLKSQKCQE